MANDHGRTSQVSGNDAEGLLPAAGGGGHPAQPGSPGPQTRCSRTSDGTWSATGWPGPGYQGRGECAWSAVRHDGYLKSLYHRHVMKWGGYRSQTAKKKAIVVVAHAMIVIIWHILATGKPYHELGAGYFTRRLDPERETRRLIARLEALGHRVTLEDAAA